MYPYLCAPFIAPYSTSFSSGTNLPSSHTRPTSCSKPTSITFPFSPPANLSTTCTLPPSCSTSFPTKCVELAIRAHTHANCVLCASFFNMGHQYPQV